MLAAQVGWATGNPNTTITKPYWGCDQAADTRVTIQNQTTCQDEQVFPCFNIPSIPDVLPAGIDWRFYGSNFYLLNEVWSMFDAIDPIRNDLAAGTTSSTRTSSIATSTTARSPR